MLKNLNININYQSLMSISIHSVSKLPILHLFCYSALNIFIILLIGLSFTNATYCISGYKMDLFNSYVALSKEDSIQIDALPENKFKSIFNENESSISYRIGVSGVIPSSSIKIYFQLITRDDSKVKAIDANNSLKKKAFAQMMMLGAEGKKIFFSGEVVEDNISSNSYIVTSKGETTIKNYDIYILIKRFFAQYSFNFSVVSERIKYKRENILQKIEELKKFAKEEVNKNAINYYLNHAEGIGQIIHSKFQVDDTSNIFKYGSEEDIGKYSYKKSFKVINIDFTISFAKVK